jgi:hypothetical protein
MTDQEEFRMKEQVSLPNQQKAEIQPLIGDGGEDLIAAAVEKKASNTLARARAFVAYAAPNTWGPDVNVASHIGVVTFTIAYEAVGDTLVLGRVTYFKGPNGGSKVTEEFRDETTITTSNSVANITCDFKGIPFGSAVNGTVTP